MEASKKTTLAWKNNYKEIFRTAVLQKIQSHVNQQQKMNH